MERSSSRTFYIVGGIILAVVVIPVLILVIAMLAGFWFYAQGAH